MDGIINQAVYCPEDYPKKKEQLAISSIYIWTVDLAWRKKVKTEMQ